MRLSPFIALFLASALSVAAEKKADVPAPHGGDALPTQVALDRANFAPGAIDGEGGEFTQKALQLYRKAHGGPGLLPQGKTGTALTVYTVTEADKAGTGPVPKTAEEQSKLKALPYATVLELVAEKFHARQDFLKKLNPQLKDRDARPGDTLKVPDVVPFEIAEVEAKKTEEEAPAAPENPEGRWIDVDVAQKELQVKEGERTIAAFPITPGSSELPAPKGHWHVTTINYMPHFRYDKAMLYHGYRSDEGILTPRGPNDKVGVLWMSLNKKGIGIHGTDEPETIGRASSHGCIRLANWDAVRVAGMIQPGARVIIH